MRRFAVWLCVLGAVGCGDAEGTGPAGGDTGVDGGADSGADTASDGDNNGADVDTDVDAPDADDADDAPDAAPDAADHPCGAQPTVDVGAVLTQQGVAQGARDHDTWAYLGLPFSAPPTGALRWAPPAPAPCYQGVHDATRDAPICPQIAGDEPYAGDEDCLYLNVWTPAPDDARRPVLFFIHGGGNTQGSPRQQSTDGSYLYGGERLAANQDAVVVTVQYRIGPLGWLVHDDLGATAGNYGTRDQIAALQWVRDNIAAFGGDPDRVLIFGESAGAVNVCMLLASPHAAGLFHAAIMQSGGCVARAREQVVAQTDELIDAAGCGDDPIACLRGKSAQELLEALPPVVSVEGRSSAWQPHIDGDVIPDDVPTLLRDGRHNRVPLIIGANSDETSLTSPMLATEAQYQAAVRAILGRQLGDRALEQYPASDYRSPRAAFVQLTTDAKFVCGARRDARAAATGQPDVPVYRYFFTHDLDNGNATLRALGAWHGLELTFVFDHIEIAGYTPSDQERALAGTFGALWSSLGRDGAPSAPQTPTWPRYDPITDPYLTLNGDGITADAGVRTTKCDFWDEVLGL